MGTSRCRAALPLNMARKLLADVSPLEFTNLPRPDFSAWVVHHKEKKRPGAAMKRIQILKGNDSGPTE